MLFVKVTLFNAVTTPELEIALPLFSEIAFLISIFEIESLAPTGTSKPLHSLL